MPSKGTPNTPIRLTEEEKDKVRAIQARYGLPSFASAIRYMVNRYFEHGPAFDQVNSNANPRKRKTSKKT